MRLERNFKHIVVGNFSETARPKSASLSSTDETRWRILKYNESLSSHHRIKVTFGKKLQQKLTF